jgi:hypothetical protein
VPDAEVSLYTRARVSNKSFIPTAAEKDNGTTRIPQAVLGNVLVARRRELDAMQDHLNGDIIRIQRNKES